MNILRFHAAACGQLLHPSLCLQLCLAASAMLFATPTHANERINLLDRVANNSYQIELSTARNLVGQASTERPRPQTTAQQLVPAEPVQIVGVQVTTTDKGVDIRLESRSPAIPQRVSQVDNNTVSYDLLNSRLALPDAQAYRSTNPAPGIAQIAVTQVTPTSVRVSITSTVATPPDVQVATDTNGSILSATPATISNDDIEIAVRGRRKSGYTVPNTSAATGTNTPILETPVSVQVVPKEVIRDQQAIQIKDALNNVSGVSYRGDVQGRSGNTFILRGFSDVQVFRDGIRRFGSSGENEAQPITEVANLERIEVVKGPASILYGAIEPGGLINLVSKQPLAQPFREVEVQAGSRNLLRPRFDVSGPLTPDGKVLYRFNGLYQTLESVRNLDQKDQKYLVAPAIAWQIDDRTKIALTSEYIRATRPADFGLPSKDGRVIDAPIDLIITEPSDAVTSTSLNIGYKLAHQLNDRWTINNSFNYAYNDFDYSVIALPLSFDAATNTVFRVPASQESQTRNYTFQTNVVGEFATGEVQHKLLAGVDYINRTNRTFSKVDFTPSFLDLTNPAYTLVKPLESDLPDFGGDRVTSNNWGFFVQDQVSVFKNLKVLAGVRYDTLSQTTTNLPGSSIVAGETTQNKGALTPRIGMLYQLTDDLSLYGNYSQSFTPNTTTTVAGTPLDPQTARGYEFGVKTELFDRKLLATLAYFDITKQNVAVTDPNNLLFSIATGEQRSQGIEFDLAGEISPGLKLIGSYAYTNAKITADSNASIIGNRLFGAPEHAASLWTTYELQTGDLKGLGFGLGFNYVGDRQGDLANTYRLGSYFTTNAALFYKRDDWRFGLNFKNITNAKYVESSFGNAAAGSSYGDPLTIVGSVGVQF